MSASNQHPHPAPASKHAKRAPPLTSSASPLPTEEMLLTRWDELSIVRPPFGKSNDFLEQIPSNFLKFPKVDPRPVPSRSLQDSKTGNRCRPLKRQRTSDPFERKTVP